MDTPRILIFANPIAGRGRAVALVNALTQQLNAHGYDVRPILQHPAEIQLTAQDRAAQAAITIGGDGTLRGIAELLFKDSPQGPALLPFPMGTANLMNRHLRAAWPADPIPAILQTLKQNRVIKLDAGLANNTLFLLMVGVGLDAQVVHLLDQVRQGAIDITSYILPTALALAAYSFPPITVQIDNQTVINNTPAIALIGNIKEYGTGFPILTQARSDDGLLDVCVMPCKNRRDLAELLLSIATGEHAAKENVIYTTGQSIDVTSPKPLAVQLDGDAAGHTPTHIQIIPARVPFLLPFNR